MISTQDRHELEEIFDGRYVRRAECDQHQAEQYKRITQVQLDTTKISTKLNIIVGILAAIGVAIVGSVVNQIFFGG